jgi:putative endonuclease
MPEIQKGFPIGKPDTGCRCFVYVEHSACEIEHMFYVYVLRSLTDSGLYIGCTADLKNRIKAHTSGKIESTQKRLPFDLIYYEACLNKRDAFHREKYLKTTYGRRYLKNRLKGYFTG